MAEAIKNFAHIFAIKAVTMLGFGEACANYVYVFLISLLPIVELRGAIPVAFAMHMPLVPSVITSVVGNLLPVPFILWLITPVCNYLKKTRFFAWLPRFLEKKVNKNRDKVEKYKFWGLFLFVAIPLPGTGAWTGALVASFIDYKFRDAFTAILCGVLVAAVIVSAVTYGLIGFIF